MKREIIEVNDFAVLIEQAFPNEPGIEICRFPEPSIGFSFYGSGNVELTVHDDRERHTYNNTKGIAISFSANERVEFVHHISNLKPLQCVCILTTPGKLQKLTASEAGLFSRHVPHLLNPAAGYTEGPGLHMSPPMLEAVEKIFANTYQGPMRSMFIRSQVVELMAHFFALLSLPHHLPAISTREREKLYQARDILTGNMETPPSLSALSKQVGLNSHTLKKQFKELFGLPVFKYLQQERLDKAHALLSTGNINIQEAAWAVGYESISSFSGAFLKKFGIRPSELRK